MAIAMLVPLSAPAQNGERDARERFEAGVAAASAKNYRRAAKEFEAAYELSPRPILLFNIGQAYRLLGDNARAAAAYRRYLDEDPRGLYSDQAREWLSEVKRKLGDGDAGRGRSSGSGQEGKDPTRAGGKDRGATDAPRDGHDQRGRSEVRTGTGTSGGTETRKPPDSGDSGADRRAEAQRAELEAAMRAAQDEDTVFAGDGSIVGTRASTDDPGASSLGAMGYTGVAAIGVGLFMSGTSVYFGVKSQDLHDDIEGAQDQWTDEQLESFERGERYDRTSKVFAGFGIPMVALGTGMLIADLISGGPGATNETDDLELGPELASDRAGLVLSGRF